MYHVGSFNFCNGVSELQMELPNFLGYFNTFVFTVLHHAVEDEVESKTVIDSYFIPKFPVASTM